MRRIAVPTFFLALAAVLVSAPVAAAAPSKSTLWATINICDSKKFPNAVGMRVSVPNRGRRRVYTRFTAQSWDRTKQRWTGVGGTGKSPWVHIGSQHRSASQGGWTFNFSRPPAGATYRIRGVVDVSWRGEAQASRRRVLVTESGKSGVKGGDPVGTSKATCRIL